MSDVMQLQFADDAERQRYRTLRELPEMQEASGIGLHVARKHAVPLILANGGRPLIRNLETGSFQSVDSAAAEFLEPGYGWAEAHTGRPLGDDGRFMFRVAFYAAVAQAKAQVAAARVATAGEKLGEGLALALAGIEACNEGLRLLGDVKPPTPLTAPRPASTVPARRKLRPQDFGSLPQGPRA